MSGSGESPAIPRYAVSELTQESGSLLDRGIYARFLLESPVSRPQPKKGQPWFHPVDGQASSAGVVWDSSRS